MAGKPDPTKPPGSISALPTITGPADTAGGANVGTGPEPITFVKCVEVRQVLKLFAAAVAKASMACFSCGVAPGNRARSALRKTDTERTTGELPCATEKGTFAVGGAWGPGQAANPG